MKKVAILGVENSHAWGFSQTLAPKEGEKRYPNVELTGCYADLNTEDGRIGRDQILARSRCTCFAARPEDFLGKADAVMCTSRHGGNHLPFLKPYIEQGLPVWVDKPITVSAADALELLRLIRTHGVPVTGGSCLKFSPEIRALAALVQACPEKVTGGHISAPVNMHNPYGDFWFYSQHLVQMMLSVFGSGVRAVRAERGENFVRAVYDYDRFSVDAYYGAGYTAAVYLGNDQAKAKEVTLDGCFDAELEEFCRMLETGRGMENDREFLLPVFVLKATAAAFETGRKTEIRVPEL